LSLERPDRNPPCLRVEGEKAWKKALLRREKGRLSRKLIMCRAPTLIVDLAGRAKATLERKVLVNKQSIGVDEWKGKGGAWGRQNEPFGEGTSTSSKVRK